jgi:Bacterial protein of unknown function (DUF916)
MMQALTSRPSPMGHIIRNILRRAGAAVALAAALLAGAFVPVPAVAAEDGAPWAVDTVDGPLGSGRQNYDYAVEPGDRLEDALMVVNNGPTPIDLAFYAADAFTTDTGQLDLRTREDAPTGVGGWLQLDRDGISLQPGESVDVPFTLAVPDDASPGSHMGGIVTTPASSPSATEPERRVAIRIHVRVGEGFRPSLTVEDLSVDYSGDPFGTGGAIVSYTIRNTGDTMLAAEQSVVVAGPFETFRVTADPVDDAPRLLPDETWTVSVPVRGVAPVWLLAATVTLVPLYTDPAGSTGPLATVEHTGHGWAIPWLPVMLILCLGALAAVVFARKRRRAAPGEILPQDAATVAHAHESPGA